MSNREIAKRMLQLFGENGEHRTIGWWAKDRKGERISSESPKAYQFCLVGASIKLGVDHRSFCCFIEAFRDVFGEFKGMAITTEHDSLTWQELKNGLQWIAEVGDEK